MATHWQDLDAAQIAFCDKWGDARTGARVASGSQHNNNLSRADAPADMDALGIRCEAAGWVFLDGKRLGGRWDYFVHSGILSETPDFLIRGVSIDVKGIDRNAKNLIIPAGVHPRTRRPYLKRDWLYFLIGAESHPRYAVLGWATGAQMAAAPVKELRKGRPAHIMQRSDLRDPADLLAMIAAREPVAA